MKILEQAVDTKDLLDRILTCTIKEYRNFDCPGVPVILRFIDKEIIEVKRLTESSRKLIRLEDLIKLK
ncbi:MAG: hypothetical protein HRU09_09155, partial [Oligoflexales bacterium]|nr:hypothetical protein [Oligoflexales bacterium]